MSDGEGADDSRRSSRRRGNTRTDQRSGALERLKEARKSGKLHRADVDNSIKNVYDEVDEDTYQDIVDSRVRSDFVVDDNGAGYTDTGADFEEDDEDDYEERAAARAQKKKEKKEAKAKKGGLSAFLVPVKAKAKDDGDVKLEDLDDLEGVLALAHEDADEEPTPTRNPFKRRQPEADAPPSPDHIHIPTIKKSRLSGHPVRPSSLAEKFKAVENASEPTRSVAAPTLGVTRRPVARAVLPPAAPSPMEFDANFDMGGCDVPDDDWDDDVDMKPDVPEVKTEPVSQQVEKKPSMEPTHQVKSEPATAPPAADWQNTQEEEKEKIIPSGPRQDAATLDSEPFCRAVEGDAEKKIIRMYWLDAFEDDRKHPGTVYLFGRVAQAGGRSASACIVVRNIKRQIFFLPKQRDSEPVPMMEVYEEIKQLFDRNRVTEHRMKTSKRRFIADGTTEDREAVDVMEVQYDAKFPRLEKDTKGTAFSAIFNTTTTSLERLLVECGIKGPGWMDVTCTPSAARTSLCKYEFEVDMANDLSGGTDNRPKNIVYDGNCHDTAPPCRIMCLNIVTALNEKKEPEIVMLSYLLSTRSSLADPSTDVSNFRAVCLYTAPPKTALPIDIEKRLEKAKLATRVRKMNNEKLLIVSFLNDLRKEDVDPDFYVGHDLQTTVSTLIARCTKHNINIWFQMSRLRRSTDIKRLGNSKSAQYEITAGRGLLDSRQAAMELVHSRNYDLGELAANLLPGAKPRMDVFPDEVASKWFSKSERIVDLVSWSWNECRLSLCVLAQMQALPLFKGITNICGGIMSRTLTGGRAERNEFLLLHAFHHAGLIAPDKYQHVFKKKDAGGKAGATDEDASPEEKAKGAQYSGGLVLEPKKGLYDSLVLLLDFNSLYPSIIQEYNICFTTIRHVKNGDELPEPPSSSEAKGVLPAQIESLVSQRYEVKKIMATERNPEKKKQYDIRQKALKLTANSMYGCLGFAQSRFYAKPLAALVTAKGREILMETKDIVERAGHDVIYGDTDSIMVNTGDRDEERAKKIAREITRTVNRLRAKLELEHEGTFRRMLLLKKKKYAALTIGENGKDKKELKGLDIVRRDWSMLAKEIGSRVVDLILDPSQSREDLVSEIEDALSALRKELDAGTVANEMFAILKSLTRDPSKYEDVKNQPHAAVAKRMNESGRTHYRQGDIVQYMICEDGTSNGPMQRAYHKLEMEGSEVLKIDTAYYLAQQVHPVISRLCAPLEELDPARIAEVLGLDATNYRRAAAAKMAADEANAAEWRESFDHCDGIAICCPACRADCEIREPFAGEGMDRKAALEACPECREPWHKYSIAITNQIRRQLIAQVEKERLAGYACDDVVCAHKMRSYPLKSTRDGFECPKCGGIMQKEYTVKQLSEQQTFFKRIVDVKKAVLELKNKDERNTISQRPHYQRTEGMCEVLKLLVTDYLSANAYNVVNLSFIFAPMMDIRK